MSNNHLDQLLSKIDVVDEELGDAQDLVGNANNPFEQIDFYDVKAAIEAIESAAEELVDLSDLQYQIDSAKQSLGEVRDEVRKLQAQNLLGFVAPNPERLMANLLHELREAVFQKLDADDGFQEWLGTTVFTFVRFLLTVEVVTNALARTANMDSAQEFQAGFESRRDEDNE